MDQADLSSGDSERQRVSDIGDCDAMLCGLNLIHAHHHSRLRVFDVPVGVDDARSVLEDRLDLLGDLRLTGEIGAVNLCDQRLHNRRSGRDLADLDASAILIADRVHKWAKPLCNRVALHAALICRQEVDLDIGLVGLAAHVVVAHQSVEVIGTGGAGVGLVVQDIGLSRKLVAEGLGDPGRLLQRSSVRHIDDDLQLALVVERQHLHAHQSRGHQRH